MNKFFKISLILLVLVLFNGCGYYSMITLQNPEFLDALGPADLDAELLDKYGVGEVIVHPRLTVADGTQTTFKLHVVFFSKTNTADVSIKAITLSVNGEKVEYGKKAVNGVLSTWDLYPINDPFYVASIVGGPIDQPIEVMNKARVDISLEVSVKDKNGKVTEKKIDVYFLPKRRTYLNPA